MGTFVEFYKVPKNKVSEEAVALIVEDKYESDDIIDAELSFFDLTLEDSVDVVELIQLPRNGRIREVLTEYMKSRGVEESPWNTSMVTSLAFIEGFRDSALKSTLWEDSDEKFLLLGFLNDQINEFDFENDFLFYTYF